MGRVESWMQKRVGVVGLEMGRVGSWMQKHVGMVGWKFYISSLRLYVVETMKNMLMGRRCELNMPLMEGYLEIPLQSTVPLNYNYNYNYKGKNNNLYT